MTASEIVNAKMSDLIAYYNEHSDKPVSKFTDRATAIHRVSELMMKSQDKATKKAAAPIASEADDLLTGSLDASETTVPAKKAPAKKAPAKKAPAKKAPAKKAPAKKATINSAHEKMSAGQRESWTNKEVREARSERSAVSVDGTEYKSVCAAFRALKLKVSAGHQIKFRMRLKEEGVLKEYGHKWTIIPLNY
jgi:hypothetical protein